MERGGRGLTQVVQDFIHNYRLKPIFEEAVAWKQHWGRVAGLVAGFLPFSCKLRPSNRKLETGTQENPGCVEPEKSSKRSAIS
jgi:hypothetical protein